MPKEGQTDFFANWAGYADPGHHGRKFISPRDDRTFNNQSNSKEKFIQNLGRFLHFMQEFSQLYPFQTPLKKFAPQIIMIGLV